MSQDISVKKALVDQKMVSLFNRVRSYFLKVFGNNSDSEDLVYWNQSLLNNLVRLGVLIEVQPLTAISIIETLEQQNNSFAQIVDTVTMNWKRIMIDEPDENKLVDMFNDIATEWAKNAKSTILNRAYPVHEEHLRELEVDDEVEIKELELDNVVVEQIVKRLNENKNNTPVTKTYVETILKRQAILAQIESQDELDDRTSEIYVSMLGITKTVTINGLELKQYRKFATTSTEQFIRQTQRVMPERK